MVTLTLHFDGKSDFEGTFDSKERAVEFVAQGIYMGLPAPESMEVDGESTEIPSAEQPPPEIEAGYAIVTALGL